MQYLLAMYITTNVASSNHTHGEMHSIHYVIKFVSDLRQVGGFFRVSSIIKIDRNDITEILLKVALNTKIFNPYPKPISNVFQQIHAIWYNKSSSN